MQEDAEQKELDLATMSALRGADNVRQRLQLEISTGTPSIGDLAYAVKIRVKEDFKIVEKVLRKRRAENKPDYNVSKIRDIVGLRIVTLYRLDALEILPLLLERIEAGTKDADSVFSPKGIEEVIIYSTNPKGDAQDLPGRVEALCAAFGLAEKTSVEETPQNYTSIHVVLWCRGKYRSAYRDLPIEVQIRTAFEDVWGEIDHSLKYKRNRPIDRDKGAEQRLALNEAHLNVMKTLIDGLAQYGDQIKLQMDVDSHERARSLSSKRYEEALKRVHALEGLDERALGLMETAVEKSQLALDYDRTQPSASARRWARRLATWELRRTLRLVTEMDFDQAHKDELLYVLNMELALVHFELGNELGGGAGNQYLVESSRIYQAQAELYPDRLIVTYRYARTLDELGDREAALRGYEAVTGALIDSDLPQDHWLRSAAPRLHGFALWEAGVGLLRKNGEENAEAARQLFEQAFLATVPALAVAQSDEEIGKTQNNLLYFAVEYLESGGEAGALTRHGYDQAALKQLANGVTAYCETVPDRRTWDTLRRAYMFLGDRERAKAAAEAVVAALTVDPLPDDQRLATDDARLRDAQKTLETLESETVG